MAQVFLSFQASLFSKMRRKESKKNLKNLQMFSMTKQFLFKVQSKINFDRAVIADFVFTLACLQRSEHSLMSENTSLIPVNAELENKSNQAPHGTTTGSTKRALSHSQESSLALKSRRIITNYLEWT